MSDPNIDEALAVPFMRRSMLPSKMPIPPGSTMILGFPDVGLVGVIAASHLIDELKLVEVAYVDSELLPPLIVLHDGMPHSSMRIFAERNIVLVISETPIPAEIIYPITNALVDWGKKKSVKMMISLSGLPIQERQDAQQLKVFTAASTQEMIKLAEAKGVEIMREGFMVGPQAVMLQRCSHIGMPAMTLLAQCFYNYPDPEAAAAVLNELAKITGTRVDVAKLIEKGEEIRLRARDMMKRTQQELASTKKGQEYDIPVYVS